MKFLELPLPDNCELGESILAHFKKKDFPLTKEDLISLVRSHQVYFQNKPVPFLPFKVFKKGKVQIYLNLEGAKISDKIVYEDKWLIAINKPPALASQSSLTFLQDHAHGATFCLLRDRKPFTSPPLFLLHRLDMATSGVLLMSKKSSINKGMQQLFEKRQIKKTYLALSKTDAEVQIPKIIKSHLGRKPDHIHNFKFASVPPETKGAKHAETHVELLSQKEDLYLFKVSPRTGRSHQIRVHLSEAGYTILGDTFYVGEKAPHLFLHAKTLSFKHPQTGEDINIEAPLPSHWVNLLDKSGLSL